MPKPNHFSPPYDSPTDNPLADAFITAFHAATPDGVGRMTADAARLWNLSALAAGVEAVVKAMTAPAVSPTIA